MPDSWAPQGDGLGARAVRGLMFAIVRDPGLIVAVQILDGISAADIQRVALQYLRPELAYLAAVGPRAIVSELAAPDADEEPAMEKAS